MFLPNVDVIGRFNQFLVDSDQTFVALQALEGGVQVRADGEAFTVGFREGLVFHR
jgi:hypothetical protein